MLAVHVTILELTPLSYVNSIAFVYYHVSFNRVALGYFGLNAHFFTFFELDFSTLKLLNY